MNSSVKNTSCPIAIPDWMVLMVVKDSSKLLVSFVGETIFFNEVKDEVAN